MEKTFEYESMSMTQLREVYLQRCEEAVRYLPETLQERATRMLKESMPETEKDLAGKIIMLDHRIAVGKVREKIRETSALLIGGCR